jgi:hypothetical protein
MTEKDPISEKMVLKKSRLRAMPKIIAVFMTCGKLSHVRIIRLFFLSSKEMPQNIASEPIL